MGPVWFQLIGDSLRRHESLAGSMIRTLPECSTHA
jgi:hypothetical protein